MKLKIEKEKILLEDENGISYVLMQKPEIEDYHNLSKRPLVVNYHKEEETIWTRFGRLLSGLWETCGKSGYFACYAILFAELYPIFTDNSQMKNIICYGMDEADGATAIFHNFADFTQEGSSFIALPATSFVFSAVLNKSCQAAVVCLDAVLELRTVCDAVSKIKKGGRLFLYTKNGEIPAVFSALPGLTEKRALGSWAVWSIPIGEEIMAFARENDADAAVVPQVSRLYSAFEELENLMEAAEQCVQIPPQAYLRAVELLWEMEEILFCLYNILDNPELPVLANALREAAMDCYIGSFHRDEIRDYFDRMRQENAIFAEAVRAEFG